MNDWEFLDPENWGEDQEYDEYEDYRTYLLLAAFDLADTVFLSNPGVPPSEFEDYDLGHIEPPEWLELVQLLDDLVDLDVLVDNVTELAAALPLPAVPSEALEDPLGFLSGILAGNLPKEPSGRKVGSPKLVKIAQSVIRLVGSFPDTAQATVRTWATMQRSITFPYSDDLFDEEDMMDHLLDSELPPAMSGFTSLIALTLMRHPEQFEGTPVPPEFSDPAVYFEFLSEWETLPDGPPLTEEGMGQAEALFAQGQLAHILADTGALGLLGPEEMSKEDQARAYSRLSRAILWIHNQCRNCEQRDEISCRVASNWAERPVPILDVAGELANTSKIEGCIKM